MINRFHIVARSHFSCTCALLIAMGAITGCATPGNDTHYERWQLEAQQAMDRGDYAVARHMLLGAENRRHRQEKTLHNLGVCSLMVAEQKSKSLNYAAAMRELDQAEGYFRRAIDVCPGFQPSLEGLNQTLELKGKFADALKQAEWMAKHVGPSPRQHIFLAREFEERGDMDGALLKYRQAVAMNPDRAESHVAFAIFLKKTGDIGGALAEFREAGRLNPKDQYVADQIAELSGQGGSFVPRYAIGAEGTSAP